MSVFPPFWIKKLRKRFKVTNQSNSLSSLEVLANPLFSEHHYLVFSTINQSNFKFWKKQLKNYLLNDQNSNINKQKLLFIVKKNQFLKKVVFKKTHGKFSLPIRKIIFFQEWNLVMELEMKIEMVVREPLVKRQCLFFLEQYFEYYFPVFDLLTQKKKKCFLIALYFFTVNSFSGKENFLIEKEIKGFYQKFLEIIRGK